MAWTKKPFQGLHNPTASQSSPLLPRNIPLLPRNMPLLPRNTTVIPRNTPLLPRAPHCFPGPPHCFPGTPLCSPEPCPAHSSELFPPPSDGTALENPRLVPQGCAKGCSGPGVWLKGAHPARIQQLPPELGGLCSPLCCCFQLTGVERQILGDFCISESRGNSHLPATAFPAPACLSLVNSESSLRFALRRVASPDPQC